jgi:UDP-4-amino-4,6-dideoxy-N-acetyl-beta-L-altrosamine transaminase
VIPYGRQQITQADIDSVVEVLRSDFLTQGPVVPRFELAVAAQTRAQHAVAVNSGTSALHIACLALGLGPGEVLWTVPNTFVASANCGRYCGAEVDFVDIDPDTWNVSVPSLADKLSRARIVGRLPKVLVPVHFSGQPTEQEAIWELAREFGFKILEDASHAIGASRHGEPVGSCRWSHVTVFSFHPVKIITTAEGGMALTNDPELAERMAALRTHGIIRDATRFETVAAGPWHHEQQFLGFNYRMTDVQAALGLSQLTRLQQLVERRNAIARRYDEILAGLPVRRPTITEGNRSAFHLYVVRLRLEAISRSHREVFEGLRARNVGVGLHYTPVHLQPYYRRLGFAPGTCPEAERYADEALTLPLYPGLDAGLQDSVASALKDLL